MQELGLQQGSLKISVIRLRYCILHNYKIIWQIAVYVHMHSRTPLPPLHTQTRTIHK